MGEASLNVEFYTQSELLLVGQLLDLPLLADFPKQSLKIHTTGLYDAAWKQHSHRD